MCVVSINYKAESHECECCGSYETYDVTISYNGKSVSFYYSSHMGDGNFDPYSETDLLVKVLSFLGYKTKVDENG